MKSLFKKNVICTSSRYLKTKQNIRFFSSWITFSLQRFGEVIFDSLLPPEANRSTATDTFYKLLGMGKTEMDFIDF